MTIKRLLTVFWVLAAALAAAGLSAWAEESAAPESSPAPENRAEEPAEWTVMFYFCGSDLESRFGYASDDLFEISCISYPDSYLPIIAQFHGIEIEPDSLPRIPRVNVLVETGGSRKWHAADLDISTDALQRWRYQCYSTYSDETINGLPSGFELMETLPLQNMADADALSDFIRWGG